MARAIPAMNQLITNKNPMKRRGDSPRRGVQRQLVSLRQIKVKSVSGLSFSFSNLAGEQAISIHLSHSFSLNEEEATSAQPVFCCPDTYLQMRKMAKLELQYTLGKNSSDTSSSAKSVVHAMTTTRDILSGMSGGCFCCCPRFCRSTSIHEFAHTHEQRRGFLDNTVVSRSPGGVVHDKSALFVCKY